MPTPHGEKVDQVLMDDLFDQGYGTGEEEGRDSLGQMMMSAFDTIERHMAPLSARQMAGLVRLQLLEGGRGKFQLIADQVRELRLLRGGYEPFLKALESGSLIKHFKGYSGRVVSGGLGAPGRGGRR